MPESFKINDGENYIERLGLNEILEQNVLENELMEKWTKINDHINLTTVDKNEIEFPENKNFSLQWGENEKGQKIGDLKMPQKAKLWEILEVTEEIDKDTFASSPEIVERKQKDVEEMGNFFFAVNKYLDQELDGIEEKNGQGVAQSISLMCKDYGEKYFSQIKEEEAIEKLKREELTDAEIEEVERFILGDIYEKRLQNISDDQKEKEIREKTLNQFFRVALKSFELEKKELMENIPSDPFLDPTPIHTKFLKRIKESLALKIEKPEEGLIKSIFQRGLELLRNELEAKNPEVREKLGAIVEFQDNIRKGYLKLRDIIGIDRLKEELSTIKREGGDIDQIAAKEREIASQIKKSINAYPYKFVNNNPSQIIEDEEMNCLGFAEIGGMLYREAGLLNGTINIPGHILNCWADSSNNVYWNDLRNHGSDFGYAIKNEDLEGNNKKGEKITTNDLIEAMQNDSNQSLVAQFNSRDEYGHDFYGNEKSFKSYMPSFEVHNIENGLLSTLLSNSAGFALKEYTPSKADIIEGFLKNSLKANKNNFSALFGLSDLYFYKYNDSSSKEERKMYEDLGLQYLREGIKLDKNNLPFVARLAQVLYDLDQNEESLSVFRKATELPFRPSVDDQFFVYKNFARALLKRGGEDDKKEALYYYGKFFDYLGSERQKNLEEEKEGWFEQVKSDVKQLEEYFNISTKDCLRYGNDLDYLSKTFERIKKNSDKYNIERIENFIEVAGVFIGDEVSKKIIKSEDLKNLSIKAEEAKKILETRKNKE